MERGLRIVLKAPVGLKMPASIRGRLRVFHRVLYLKDG